MTHPRTPSRWCDACPWKDVGFCPGMVSRDKCYGVLSGIDARTQAVIDSIPMAGDVVELIAKTVGADKLAKKWEELIGTSCGCDRRKEWLNRATERLLEWAKR